ncbi:MAG: CPBP family intramembrane metalloprotease [Flavobacteriaceae bacterium]|nr:CPBP family intramembrane metalloprotease [Flavobacteriaceae bacterium]
MLKSNIQKYPLISFVVINYLITWIFLYPCYKLILNAEEGTFPPLALIGFIGAYGPTISAIIVEKITNGNRGIKELLKKLLVWKVHIKWYLFIFFIPILLYTVAVLTSKLFGFQLGQINLKDGLSSSFLFILIALPFGPMGEELGWRGFFLPRLLQKYKIWKSSIIIGFVWTIWHLASFTFPGAAIPSIFEVNLWTLFLYLLTIIGESLLFTYLFLKTRFSVLIAILFHAVFNASSNIVLTIFPQVENIVEQREIIYIINFLLIALLSIVLLVRINKTYNNKKITTYNKM